MPKVVNHALVRAELLEAGFRVFARQGYAAVSMRKLAAELGTSTGTLYHYFEGKQAFFEQMVRHVAAIDVRRALAAISFQTELRDKLRATAEFVRENEAHLQELVMLGLDYVRHEPGARAAVADATREFEEAIRQQLGATGGNQLLAMLIGVLVLRRFDPYALRNVDLVPAMGGLATIDSMDGLEWGSSESRERWYELMAGWYVEDEGE